MAVGLKVAFSSVLLFTFFVCQLPWFAVGTGGGTCAAGVGSQGSRRAQRPARCLRPQYRTRGERWLVATGSRSHLSPIVPNPLREMVCGYWKPLSTLLVLGHVGTMERVRHRIG